MIDAHYHLDLYPDAEAVTARAINEGHYILSVTTTPKAWRNTLALAKGAPRIRTALGLHPELAFERHRELALFEALLPEARYVGEIGLDGSPAQKPHQEIQLRCFKAILNACAAAGGRIMSVHSRRAASAVLDAYQERSNAGILILHWFSGNQNELARAVRADCWFSVGPAMVRSASGRALLSAIPAERVITETDGPFGKNGTASLGPGQVGAALQTIAEIWRVHPSEAEARIANNFRALTANVPSFPDQSVSRRAPMR